MATAREIAQDEGETRHDAPREAAAGIVVPDEQEPDGHDEQRGEHEADDDFEDEGAGLDREGDSASKEQPTAARCDGGAHMARAGAGRAAAFHAARRRTVDPARPRSHVEK